MTKALQKSRQFTSVALFLSTDAVTPPWKVTGSRLALGEAVLAVLNHLPVPSVP